MAGTPRRDGVGSRTHTSYSKSCSQTTQLQQETGQEHLICPSTSCIVKPWGPCWAAMISVLLSLRFVAVPPLPSITFRQWHSKAALFFNMAPCWASKGLRTAVSQKTVLFLGLWKAANGRPLFHIGSTIGGAGWHPLRAGVVPGAMHLPAPLSYATAFRQDLQLFLALPRPWRWAFLGCWAPIICLRI